MRPPTNAHGTLPLHRGGGANGASPAPASAATKQLHAAMEKGLGLVGVSATKAGAGEKEKAFIVRENAVLRAVLCLVLLGVVGVVVLFSTVYELHVARRGRVLSEVIHHKKEHLAHEALVRANLGLQQAPENAVEETQAMQEFRAYFEKTVGVSDDALDQLFQNQGVKPEVLAQAKQMQRDFVKNVEVHLGKMLKRFQKRADEAEKEMAKISKRIEEQIQEDAEEDQKFEEKLEELGVTEEYAENVEDQYEDKQHEGQTEEQRKAEEAAEHEDEAEIESQVKDFFDRLAALDAPIIPPDTIKQWEQALDTIVDTLGDSTKEVDLDMAGQKMRNLVTPALGGHPIGVFDPSKHDSQVEFYQVLLEKLKVMPHKQALVDLYNGYKAGKAGNGATGQKISAFTLMANVQKLVQENNLFHLVDWMGGEDPDPNTPFEDNP